MSKNAGKLASGTNNESGKRPNVIPYIAREQGTRSEPDLESNSVSEVDFAELSDGSIIEMIEDPQDATRTLFAVYRDQSISYMDRLEDRGRMFVPLPRQTEILKYVRLAQGAEPYGKAQNLENEVGLILRACLDLDADSQTLMAAFVISTWLQENSPVAPYLALVGPPGSGKTTVMRVLNSLCYRSLFTTDISPSAFYDVCHRLRPTLLIDETLTAGQPRELIHLLKASSTPDAVSLRKGSARLAYGAKAFAWLELPNDAALNSRCLIVPTRRTSNARLKPPCDPQVLCLAKTARKHLLQFRLEHIKKSLVMPAIPGDVALFGRPLDLYRALAFPFADDESTRVRLARLIWQQQRQHQAHVLSPVLESLLRVLYLCIHQESRHVNFEVKYLTALVNDDLLDRGEAQRVNERKLGSLLTSLSLTDRERTNAGYVLHLNRLDRVRIHEMVRDYRVDQIQGYARKHCELCRLVR